MTYPTKKMDTTQLSDELVIWKKLPICGNAGVMIAAENDAIQM